jgi:hypothetical protein
MHAISALKTMFAIVVYRLATSAFYSMDPRAHTWLKVVTISLLFLISFGIVDILEKCFTSVVLLTVVSTGAQMVRWLLCFIIAQFTLFAIEDVSLHWGYGTFGTTLVVMMVFILVFPLVLPLALRFGLFWCDCEQKTCLICQFCRNKWKHAFEGRNSKEDPYDE